MFDYPDNPIIRNCELTGYPDGKEPELPRCPICGKNCNDFYKSSREKEIVGCENCIRIIDSYYLDGE